MPQQIYCHQCYARVFYIMLQDDGNIEAYCQMHNHKCVIVNIPELIAHVYKTESEDSIETYKDNGTTVRITSRPKAEGKESSDDSLNITSSHAFTTSSD